MESNKKNYRSLVIYKRLINGEIVNKKSLAEEFGVAERSIQRDIDDIREFLDDEAVESGCHNYVIYDRAKKGFRIENIYRMKFSNPETLAIAKILLDSRAFGKDELTDMLSRLIKCCVPKKNEKTVKALINNELFHYVEPCHGVDYLNTMWDIGVAVSESRFVEIDYYKPKDKKTVSRKLKPVAIMFNEFYFYLIAFIENKEIRENFDFIKESFPAIYRMDRIKNYKVLDERFKIPYKNRFEEGEFRKRIQFMYGGKLRTITFKYKGYYPDAIVDRLPTAVIVNEEDGVYTFRAEVYGDGIDMWLRSQGELIEII